MNHFNEVADIVEQGWTQQRFARDVEGYEVSFDSAEAVCWCAMGAMRKAIPNPEIYYDHLTLLSVHTHSLIAEWNDMPNQTQENVVATLRELADEPL